MATKLTCAKRPCASCPYRKDVPSGIWIQEEYDKLPLYDGEIYEQVMKGAIGVFMCHQKDGNLCAGWLAAHKPINLVAMRMAAMSREIDSALFDYKTDVPVFSSGAKARKHGMKDLHKPRPRAVILMSKLLKKGLGQPKEEELE